MDPKNYVAKIDQVHSELANLLNSIRTLDKHHCAEILVVIDTLNKLAMIRAKVNELFEDVRSSVQFDARCFLDDSIMSWTAWIEE